LAKKMSEDQMAYEAARFDEQWRGEVIQDAATGTQQNANAGRKTSPSSSAFFGEGFIPHLAHHCFSSPEVGEIRMMIDMRIKC
jgi:hypothetical protein